MTGLDDMRIGDAERDTVTEALHEHFAAGRLDRAELDERLGTTLAAKTQGDLRAIVKDLPGPNGLPEPECAVPALGQGHEPGFGLAHAAHGHPARWHGHGHFRAAPLLVGVFLFVAIAAGPGAAIMTVLQVALLVWVVRALALAFGTRRRRPVGRKGDGPGRTRVRTSHL